MPALTHPFIGLLAALSVLSSAPALAAEVHGRVCTAQGPLADTAVTLWAAGADAPRQLAQTRSSADGSFVPHANAEGGVLYVIAKGGHPVGKSDEPNGLGGGSGLTVIYGVAALVRPPRMGVVRPN